LAQSTAPTDARQLIAISVNFDPRYPNLIKSIDAEPFPKLFELSIHLKTDHVNQRLMSDYDTSASNNASPLCLRHPEIVRGILTTGLFVLKFGGWRDASGNSESLP
jgi:hypothetical protein